MEKGQGAASSPRRGRFTPKIHSEPPHPRATAQQRKRTLRPAGLHAHELQVVPHPLQQVVEVPAMVSGDGNAVRDLVDDVQLLDGDLVDLIQHVDAGDVHSADGRREGGRRLQEKVRVHMLQRSIKNGTKCRLRKP